MRRRRVVPSLGLAGLAAASYTTDVDTGKRAQKFVRR